MDNVGKSRRTNSDNRGAAAVEFAIVLPLLLTVLFGIIEFGWVYTQQLDVRHGAREGARLVSVNDFPPGEDASTMTATQQTDHLVASVCQRMDFADNARVSITLDDPLVLTAGASAVVTVEADLATITGWFDPILGGKRLESVVEFRMEQEAQWEATTDKDCP